MPWIDGYRMHAIYIAYAKGLLLLVPMPPAEQLDILESFESVPRFSPAVVAAIEPASAAFMRIVYEAGRLDPPEPPTRMLDDGRTVRTCSDEASAIMLTTEPVWPTLTALNPSILT